MDDKEIIKLIAQGDTSAFSLLLNRFKRPVFSLLAGIVHNREEDEELMIKLESAVKQLDADANALISLYYNQDKSIKEIADIMQLSAENVKVRLFRIRKRLVYLTNQM